MILFSPSLFHSMAIELCEKKKGFECTGTTKVITKSDTGKDQPQQINRFKIKDSDSWYAGHWITLTFNYSK